MSFYKDYLKQKKDSPQEKEEKLVDNKPELEEKEEVVPQEKDEEPAQEPENMTSQQREEIERQRFLKRIEGEDSEKLSSQPQKAPEIKKETTPETVIPPVPPKPPKSQKIWARVIILLALICAIGLISFLWYRLITDPPKDTEVITEVEEIEIKVPEVIAPQSLIDYSLFREGVVTRDNEISSYLSQYLEEEFEEGSFVKIMLKDQRDQDDPGYLSFDSFLSNFRIRLPEIDERIDKDNFNLFVYSQSQGNRLGFIAEITDIDGFPGMMREWENDTPGNVSNFISFFNVSPTPLKTSFDSLMHRNERIWCQEYAEDDFGICYSVLSSRKPFFIFTTSLQSARSIIDKI